MKRLTTDKDVSQMSMVELAHNACYVKDRKARYRDYDMDMDARVLAIHLLADLAESDAAFESDEDMDGWMADYMQYGPDTIEGLIAAFYTNIWAAADLRERLKYYENLKEQGMLIEMPCRFGDTVYVKMQSGEYAEAEVRDFNYFHTCGFCVVVTSDKFDKQSIPFSEFGKSVFLTMPKSEQEK